MELYWHSLYHHHQQVCTIYFSDVEIGFFTNETTVSEDSGIVQLNVGVISGNLERTVNLTFMAIAGTAEGNSYGWLAPGLVVYVIA